MADVPHPLNIDSLVQEHWTVFNLILYFQLIYVSELFQQSESDHLTSDTNDELTSTDVYRNSVYK